MDTSCCPANVFNSNAITGTSNGLLASLFNIEMPLWWCKGLCFRLLWWWGIHYAPFAYILIGGIFKNMDANLEEAATILDTPKHKIFTKNNLTDDKTSNIIDDIIGVGWSDGFISCASLFKFDNT